MSVVPKVVRPLLNRAVPVIGRRAKSCPPTDVWKPTLNDLPSPCGSWAEAQKKRNVKYNLHLAIGVVTFAATVTYMYYDEDMFFNARLPELPEEEFGKRPKRAWLNILKVLQGDP